MGKLPCISVDVAPSKLRSGASNHVGAWQVTLTKTGVPLFMRGPMGCGEDLGSTFLVQSVEGRLSMEGVMGLNQGQCGCMEEGHTGKGVTREAEGPGPISRKTQGCQETG